MVTKEEIKACRDKILEDKVSRMNQAIKEYIQDYFNTTEESAECLLDLISNHNLKLIIGDTWYHFDIETLSMKPHYDIRIVPK